MGYVDSEDGVYLTEAVPINTKLVVDLGGIHPRQTQSVTLGTAKGREARA